MRIAIIGTGISGLVVAYKLRKQHDVRCFEANDYVGGHTHTHHVRHLGHEFAIDTGFIVFNDRTYPNFIGLLTELGVAFQPSVMSFSVSNARTGLEYCGTNLNGVFAQRRNLLRPRFYRMLRDVLRFNRDAEALLQQPAPGPSLGEYLHAHNYCDAFREDYLLPMGAAIWSSPLSGMIDFPARSFVEFFKNHGLLTVQDQPQWYVVKGGSKSYVDKIVAALPVPVATNSTVSRIERGKNGISITVHGEAPATFDRVVLGCHADQALAMLGDATHSERDVLGAIAYRPNEAALHTDQRFLPINHRAWSSWNYRVEPDQDHVGPTLTYDMNRLQSLDCTDRFCVTLNQTNAIDQSKLIKTLHYEHPVFNAAAVAAQQRWSDIDGVAGTHFCGAYWGHGFHEDGVVSALRVVDKLEQHE